LHHYQELFNSGGTSGLEICLAGLENRITPEMNQVLSRVFTELEVDEALKQMQPMKSPGPDGFSAGFFQRSWPIVREEVCKTVLDFLNYGHFESSLNDTHIVLIPKIKSPVSVTDFRPISLCNVLYKIVAKVLANRMKTVLPHIISYNQSAFIPGRHITDNIIVAFEAFHTMATRLKGKQGVMALKLDMSKAYDRVEWDFLEAIMRKIGFSEQWVQLVMKCVRTVTYAVLINGQPHGRILPSRGIRQGDPLSPYLFLLCAEGLSHLLCKAKQERHITGVAIARKGPQINHLFFADDSVLFCKANAKEWEKIQALLELYEKASGQKLNREKTSLLFSKNTPQVVKDQLVNLVGVTPTSCFEKYLGLPSMVGKSRIASFSSIKGRIWERINGWKEKFLSHAGKEVLMKAVLQAIPTYTMSVFKLPKSLSQGINSLFSKFWWGNKKNESKIAWMKWSKMGLAKHKGGLGYRDLEHFNTALLAKQGWRIMLNPDSLVAQVLKSKYFSKESFIMSRLGSNPSYVWRSIWGAKHLVQAGMRWRVGNGNSIKIWGDKWIDSTSSGLIQAPVRVLGENAKVSALIDDTTHWWNYELIREIFPDEEAKRIYSMVLSPLGKSDQLVWAGTKKGIFTVRSAYHMAKELSLVDKGECSTERCKERMWQVIWKLNCPRVVHLFLWKACNNILPTKENLAKRAVTSDDKCPICKSETETVGHSLWSCPAAKDVWMECPVRIQKSPGDEDDFSAIFERLMERLSAEELRMMIFVARQIWFRRNDVVFNEEFRPPEKLIQAARTQMEQHDQATAQWKEVDLPLGKICNRTHVRWKKPQVGVIKINWDAAIEERTGTVGLGARDHELYYLIYVLRFNLGLSCLSL
jgi:hypothetical protein